MLFSQYHEVRAFFDENQLLPSEYDMSAIVERWSGLKKGLLAGSLGIAALSPFAIGDREAPNVRIPNDSPEMVKIREIKKDQGLYYDQQTARKIIKMAEEGDEWAIRELPWPEGHPFHKKGRPFHKNSGPHPEGLIHNSGY